MDTIFVDNISLFLMCRYVIERDRRMRIAIVRHENAIEASLGTYLDFWYNSLPYSVDRECQPICSVSPEACYVVDENCRVAKAELNAPIEEVVREFDRCRTQHYGDSAEMQMSEVAYELWDGIGNGKIRRDELCGWLQFYMPAKVSVFSNKLVI